MIPGASGAIDSWLRQACEQVSSLIRVTNIGKRFGATQAVSALSFEIGAGEVVGFVGPNGAGKTTTLRMLSGYLEADEGQIEVAGFDMGKAGHDARAQVGYMPERTPLCDDMRVQEFLRFRARIKGLDAAASKRAVAHELERFALGEVQHRLIGNLSRGFRQRVALADAIVANPSVLLLDEPTTGLDPLQRRGFRKLLVELAKGRSVLFSSHVLSEVEAVISRLIIINKGSLVADGDLPSLRLRAGLAQGASAEEVFAALVVEGES